MINILLKSLWIAFIKKFLFAVLYKLGVIDYFQIHTKGLVHKLFGCDFCMSFWIVLIIVVIFGLNVLIIPCTVVIMSQLK